MARKGIAFKKCHKNRVGYGLARTVNRRKLPVGVESWSTADNIQTLAPPHPAGKVPRALAYRISIPDQHVVINMRGICVTSKNF